MHNTTEETILSNNLILPLKNKYATENKQSATTDPLGYIMQYFAILRSIKLKIHLITYAGSFKAMYKDFKYVILTLLPYDQKLHTFLGIYVLAHWPFSPN